MASLNLSEVNIQTSSLNNVNIIVYFRNRHEKCSNVVFILKCTVRTKVVFQFCTKKVLKFSFKSWRLKY